MKQTQEQTQAAPGTGTGTGTVTVAQISALLDRLDRADDAGRLDDYDAMAEGARSALLAMLDLATGRTEAQQNDAAGLVAFLDSIDECAADAADDSDLGGV